LKLRALIPKRCTARSTIVLDVEKRIPQAVLDQLQAREHNLEIGSDWSNPTAATMVEYDLATGVISGGADVRGHRYALAS
jgi:hypothetical protein